MKKIFIFSAGCLFSLGALAAGFALFNEYRDREQMKITPAQVNVLNFLVQLEFTTQKIINIEAIGTSQFLVKSRTGTLCAGDIDQGLVSCKNELGFSGKVVPDEASVAGLGSQLASSSPLAQEFKRRDSKVITPEVQAILAFLKLNDYSAEDVMELEVMNPSTSFVIRNRNGDICLGEIDEALLRCKNEMGITGVVFQGDSD